jgi:tetratricopeptide (TPR) repeat protein
MRSSGRFRPDYAIALNYIKKAKEFYEKNPQGNQQNMPTSYNNLSLIYKAFGKLDKALEYIEKAIAIMKKKFPGGHPNLDVMLGNLEYIKMQLSD